MTNITLTLTLFKSEGGYRGYCNELGLVSEPARRKTAALEILKHDIEKELKGTVERDNLTWWLDHCGFVYRVDSDELLVPVVEEQRVSMLMPARWHPRVTEESSTGETNKSPAVR